MLKKTLEDERGLVHRNLDELCHIVPHLEDNCRDHPESCRKSRIQLETVERAMENGVKTLNFLNYVCDVGERPDTKTMMERCSANNRDFTLETNSDLEYLVFREKRFIFSALDRTTRANAIFLLNSKSEDLLTRAILLQDQTFTWNPQDHHTLLFDTLSRKNVD